MRLATGGKSKLADISADRDLKSAWWSAPKLTDPPLEDFVEYAQFGADREFPEIPENCNHIQESRLTTAGTNWRAIRYYRIKVIFPLSRTNLDASQ
jgi:hypothetical protein